MKHLFSGSLIILSVAAFPFPVTAASINFDGTGAPPLFSDASPLTNLYSGLGVTFSGISGPGMEILNQAGNFGFNARSGTDFLAFNNGTTGVNERLSFSSLVSSISIWAASSSGGSFTMNAFDIGNNLLGTSSISGITTWQQLSLTASGIARVDLLYSNANGAGGYDDLEFSVTSTVPEPSTLALFGLSLFGLVFNKRKRL